jgi:choline dehydrogenase-like flavoprotein
VSTQRWRGLRGPHAEGPTGAGCSTGTIAHAVQLTGTIAGVPRIASIIGGDSSAGTGAATTLWPVGDDPEPRLTPQGSAAGLPPLDSAPTCRAGWIQAMALSSQTTEQHERRRDILIIGSGPAAAAVALAARAVGGIRVQVVDVGQRLENERRELLESVLSITPSAWPSEARAQLSRPALPEVEGELPQKRQFGSDFPFRDAGQLGPYSVSVGGNRHPISGAYGGFSNVWGAQILPFSRETLAQWPVNLEELEPHYRAMLLALPFAGRGDDYQQMFPLFGTPDPLPPVSAAIASIESEYERHLSYVRSRGVTVGAARLAMRAPSCVSCGLCLTGCPYGLIYSASQTFDELVSAGSISYRSQSLVVGVGEDDQRAWADIRDLRSGATERIWADHVFMACGGIGSTRLVLASARRQVRRVELSESVQLVMPFFSLRAGPDPWTMSTFTLNQLNMLIEYGRPGLDMAHFHLYPYNRGFDDALPAGLSRRPRIARAVLRRTVAGLGYLPSWHSPQVRLDVLEAKSGDLPGLAVSAVPRPGTGRALAKVMAKLIAVAPALDLWPGVPALAMSGPAKSYHFGGSLPHVSGQPREGAMETDTLGRLAEWDRIHVVDGAVFPTVPATTFTLTVMANAHRIADAVLRAG